MYSFFCGYVSTLSRVVLIHKSYYNSFIMNRKEVTQKSIHLQRNMNLIVYGTTGLPVLGFPTQNSSCGNYEEFGMIDAIAQFIESGAIQLFCVDSIDTESWSDSGGNAEHRAWLQEQYFLYITEEVLPFMLTENNCPQKPLVMGLSMGGTHAAITFLRRPDLFSGLLAISGVYDTQYFFGPWMNDTLYFNAPLAFIPNMPLDHPYIAQYNAKKMVFCVGQGAWEEEGIRTLATLGRQFEQKGILAWIDFWGFDVSHDWPWWFKMARYFLPHFLMDMPGTSDKTKTTPARTKNGGTKK